MALRENPLFFVFLGLKIVFFFGFAEETYKGIKTDCFCALRKFAINNRDIQGCIDFAELGELSFVQFLQFFINFLQVSHSGDHVLRANFSFSLNP